jgi:hypothetical protein
MSNHSNGVTILYQEVFSFKHSETNGCRAGVSPAFCDEVNRRLEVGRPK